MNMAQRGLILLVRIYQRTVSPILRAALGESGRCRFQPSCSRYAVESVNRHGAMAGSWLAVKRLARCHPWGKFGEDPVPEKRAGDVGCGVSEFGHCHHGS